MSAFVGLLTDTSPLREIFRDGCVPLRGAAPIMALLEVEPGKSIEEACYPLSLPACTPAEREGLALAMHRAGRGSLEEARRVVRSDSILPIRSGHIRAVTFSLRHVL